MSHLLNSTLFIIVHFQKAFPHTVFPMACLDPVHTERQRFDCVSVCWGVMIKQWPQTRRYWVSARGDNGQRITVRQPCQLLCSDLWPNQIFSIWSDNGKHIHLGMIIRGENSCKPQRKPGCYAQLRDFSNTQVLSIKINKWEIINRHKLWTGGISGCTI